MSISQRHFMEMRTPPEDPAPPPVSDPLDWRKELAALLNETFPRDWNKEKRRETVVVHAINEGHMWRLADALERSASSSAGER